MDTVWLGRNNPIDKAMQTPDGDFVDAPSVLDATNKLRLLLTDGDGNEVAYDSQTNPTYFSVATTRQLDGNTVRLITLLLGSSGLQKGEYDAVLTLFSPTYPLGIVVGEFRIVVRSS
jgi:hypothetical protein